MAKKPVTKAKKAAPKKAAHKAAARKPARLSTARTVQHVEKMSGGVVVGGSIIAGRNVIQGDQYNTTDTRVAQINSAPELVAELGKLRAEIAALKRSPQLDAGDAQLVQVIEGRVVEAAQEAAKPEPDKGKVITTLEKASQTMTALGAGVTTAIGLGEAIGKVAPYLGTVLEGAKRLFGGG